MKSETLRRAVVRCCRGLTVLATTIFIGLAAEQVAAHALPNARAVALHPDDPTIFTVQADSAGLVVSNNPEGRLELVCNAHAGLLESGFDRVYMRYTLEGRLLVGSFTGLRLASPDGCHWEEVGPPGVVRAVVSDPVELNVSYALLAPAGGAPARVVSTEDDGHTWTAVHAFAPDVRATSMVVTATSPRTFYVVVERSSALDGSVSRSIASSDDGGTQWRETAVSLGPFAIHWASTVDLGRALLVEDVGESGARIHLWQGESSEPRPVLNVRTFGGMATRDEGETLWVGDAEGGIFESQDRGNSFVVVNAEQAVGCLKWAHDRLWGCTDNWRIGHFLVASLDDGRSFVPVQSFACVNQLAACDEAMALTCDYAWQDWTAEILEPSRELGTNALCPDTAQTGGCALAPIPSDHRGYMLSLTVCLILFQVARAKRAV